MHGLLIFTTFFVRALAAGPESRIYTLLTDFTATPARFFQEFAFFTEPDPTHGTVSYVDKDAAAALGIIGFSSTGPSYMAFNEKSDNILLGVDATQIAPSGSGRASVRLSSTQTFNPGTLFVIDVEHLPAVCGTWPAFWAVGADTTWPNGGEFDIIEGGNALTTQNTMTLHTSAGCSISANGTSGSIAFSGSLVTPSCDVNAPGQAQNQGCSIAAPTTAPTFGEAFNTAGGGTFVAEWSYSSLAVWFFPHNSSLPASLAGNPDTSTLGTPIAQFAGPSCDWSAHFQQMQLVINTSLCGDWAGAVWESGGCAAQTGVATCEAYVQDNPAAFAEAYWSIRSLKAYSMVGGASRFVRGRM